MKYDIFIKEMSDCDGYILFQDNTLRNQARFLINLATIWDEWFYFKQLCWRFKIFVERTWALSKLKERMMLKSSSVTS